MMFSKPSHPLIGVMLAALAAIALSAYVAWQVSRPTPVSRSDESIGGAAPAQAKIGGPFDLIDHAGNRVTDAQYRGNLMLIYFGYGHCPDICPMTLQTIGLALDEMGDAAKTVQPIFITVDPRRDTVARLARYVPRFHSRLIGLTGTRSEIAETAAAYRVTYAKVETGGGEDYLVDHSNFIYLMGRDGSLLTMFRGHPDPKNIAVTITGYLEGRKPPNRN